MINDHQSSIWGIGSEKITENKSPHPSGRAAISLFCIIMGVIAEFLTGFFTRNALSLGQDVLRDAGALGLSVFNASAEPELAPTYAQFQHDWRLGALFWVGGGILVVIGLLMTINARVWVHQRLHDPQHLVQIARAIAALALIAEVVLFSWVVIAGLFF